MLSQHSGENPVGGSFREGGFSLIETLLVVAILVIVGGIAIPLSGTVIGQAKADSATSVVLGALQEARARAIAERRNFQLDFVAPNIIRVTRLEQPGPGTTVVAQTYLEGNQEFQLVDGVDPLGEFGADTAVDFTGTLPVMFTTDGSLIDSNGDPVNGTIHMAHDVSADSSRAVTILGVTGLMQTWKWTGTVWSE
jgi:Tfp pilus assembly protein FimT